MCDYLSFYTWPAQVTDQVDVPLYSPGKLLGERAFIKESVTASLKVNLLTFFVSFFVLYEVKLSGICFIFLLPCLH